MTLTIDDLQILRRPFASKDHEFIRGFAYITEGAITTRIEDVDPAWSFEVLSIVTRDNQVVATARMTIKGVSRDGVGMQLILEKGGGEPEKGAATDAMKRCARLFGIGRYLLDLPSEVDNPSRLQQWLNPKPAQTTAQPPEPQLPPAAAIFGQNEQKRIPTPEYSKTYENELTKVIDIQAMGNGGKRYKFLTKGGRHVSCFGSDIFKAANIDTSDWKAQWKLDPPIPVRIEEKIGKDNNMYYNVTAVLSDAEGQAA